jgi:hypothetical protein
MEQLQQALLETKQESEHQYVMHKGMEIQYYNWNVVSILLTSKEV